MRASLNCAIPRTGDVSTSQIFLTLQAKALTEKLSIPASQRSEFALFARGERWTRAFAGVTPNSGGAS